MIEKKKPYIMSQEQKDYNKKKFLENLACEKKRGSKKKGRGGLTPKEAKIVSNKAKGMANADAYEDAYETTSTNRGAMSANATKILNKPHVREALDNALDKAGVTADYVVGNAVSVFEGASGTYEKLGSLKFLAELKRLVGAGATVEQSSPKTVNILNLNLDKLGESELMDLLMNAKRD